MAGRGKPRTPTAVLAAKGSWRAKARMKTEPKAPSIPLELIPPEVGTKGAAYWMKFAPVLSAMGILDQAAKEPLIDLCVMCVERDEALARCRREGKVIEVGAQFDGRKKIKAGKRVSNPWALEAARLRKDIIVLQREFGLLPGSRSRVEVDAGFGKPVPTSDTGTENKRPLGI